MRSVRDPVTNMSTGSDCRLPPRARRPGMRGIESRMPRAVSHPHDELGGVHRVSCQQSSWSCSSPGPMSLRRSVDCSAAIPPARRCSASSIVLTFTRRSRESSVIPYRAIGVGDRHSPAAADAGFTALANVALLRRAEVSPRAFLSRAWPPKRLLSRCAFNGSVFAKR